MTMTEIAFVNNPVALAYKEFWPPIGVGEVTFFDVLLAASKVYKVSHTRIRSRQQDDETVHMRHIVIYVLYKASKISMRDVSFLFRYKNHSAVIKARRKIDKLLTISHEARAEVTEICRIIGCTIVLPDLLKIRRYGQHV